MKKEIAVINRKMLIEWLEMKQLYFLRDDIKELSGQYGIESNLNPVMVLDENYVSYDEAKEAFKRVFFSNMAWAEMENWMYCN